MILITGASGKTGKAVIQALARAGQAVRAMVHHPEQIATVQSLGAAEALSGDMADRAAVRQALQGAQAVYHICPNMNPAELLIGQVTIEEARSAGVEHFVYHSVLHPQTQAMPHHWQKLLLEERLFESGLPFTILQPAPYMQNLLAYWQQITTSGIYAVPYAPTSRLSLVDLEDVAAAVAAVLTSPGHTGAIYELVGTLPLSQEQVAEVLSQELKRPVIAQVISRQAWEQTARQGTMSDYAIRTLLAMFKYYEEYGLGGSPQVLTWLLDRTPTTLPAFFQRILG
jgi:NAD(P)H dehydrogenase (quinone)